MLDPATDRHFLNLTRGLLLTAEVSTTSVIRVQSTWCEQGLWHRLLEDIDYCFLYQLSRRRRVVVHDISERVRVPRALWQGCLFLKYVLTRHWTNTRIPCLVRTGMDVEPYFSSQYWSEPVQAVLRSSKFRYFKRMSGGTVIPRLEWVAWKKLGPNEYEVLKHVG